MNQRICWSVFLCLFLPFLAISQQKTLFSGPVTDVSYKKLGSIRSCLGTLNDEYILLENNYGGPMDFNNNIVSNISTFSIKTGVLKSRFNLNELISNSKNKGVNKILVTDVVVWNGKLFAFYTIKNPSGKTFKVDAIIFNTKGQLIKHEENIGIIRHGAEQSSFLGQGGLIVNGRNTISVYKEFRFKISPDSSRLLVYTNPDKSEGNVRLLSYDDNLTVKEDVSLSIPLKEKEANLVDFGLDKSGNIYMLVRTMKSKATLKENPDGGSHYTDLYIRDAKEKTLRAIPITVDGELVINAKLLFTLNETYCQGTYSHTDKKSAGWIKGSYSIPVNLEDPLESPIYKKDLPTKTIEGLSPKPKKGERIDGIPYNFEPYQILPDGSGGQFVIQSSEVIEVQVRGRTGALNTYSELTRAFLVTHIGQDRSIRWTNAFYRAASNTEFSTRLERPLFFVKKGELAFLELYQENPKDNKTAISIKSFNDQTGEFENSDQKTDLVIPQALWEFKTLEKSMVQWNQNEYIFTVFDGQIALMRYNL